MPTATNKLTAAETKLCKQVREFVRLAQELRDAAFSIADGPRVEFIELFQSYENGLDLHRQVIAAGVAADNTSGLLETTWPPHLPRLS